MERKRAWVSDNKLWKVTLRIDDADLITKQPAFWCDIAVSKLNKQGRYELSHVKKFNKEVTAVLEDFQKLKRCEHKKFIATHYDPYQALSLNDAIEVHTGSGHTDKVYFQSKTDDTITVLHYVEDRLETINKSDVVEMTLHCTLSMLNERRTYQLI